MFSLRAKQQPNPSISASDSSKFQFYIDFRSFQPDFLSVFHDNDKCVVSPEWYDFDYILLMDLMRQPYQTV